MYICMRIALSLSLYIYIYIYIYVRVGPAKGPRLPGRAAGGHVGALNMVYIYIYMYIYIYIYKQLNK